MSSSSISLLFRAINTRNFHSKYVVARFSSSISSDHNMAGTFGKLSQDDPFAGNRASGAPNRSATDEPGEKDTAKAGAAVAVDAGLKLGEAAKKTMDGMWDAAKETAESVRDSVGPDDDSGVNDDHYRRQLRPSDDKHVDDLRRKAGGYDFKDN